MEKIKKRGRDRERIEVSASIKPKIYILSIDCEISKPIHWCPFSEKVSPLSPDLQPIENHNS